MEAALVSIEPLEHNIMEWHGNLKPVPGSVYDRPGLLFHFRLDFPEDYPASSPRLTLCHRFKSAHTYHASAWGGRDGYLLCLDLLEADWIPDFGHSREDQGFGWSAGYSVLSILLNLISFMFDSEETRRVTSQDVDAMEEEARGFRCTCGHTHRMSWPAASHAAVCSAPRPSHAPQPSSSYARAAPDRTRSSMLSEGRALRPRRRQQPRFHMRPEDFPPLSTLHAGLTPNDPMLPPTVQRHCSSGEANQCWLLQLPSEVLLQIVRQLPAKTRLRASQCCHTMYQLCEDPSVSEKQQLTCYAMKYTMDEATLGLGVWLTRGVQEDASQAWCLGSSSWKSARGCYIHCTLEQLSVTAFEVSALH